jgi:indolepyruvate ferredoxin oxidoreductase
VRLTGIGGTGVVTVSQIVGTAAMLAGRHVRGLDQTGLSQKAGPVVSDLRITRDEVATSNHAACRASTACWGSICSWLPATATCRGAPAPHRGGRVDRRGADRADGHEPRHRTPAGVRAARSRVGQVTRTDDNRCPRRRGLAARAPRFHDHGEHPAARRGVQAGAIPVPPEAIEEAITLNGVAVDTNLAAFRWGRAWVDDPPPSSRRGRVSSRTTRPETLDELIERLAADLVDYQSAAYAHRFRRVVADARPPSRRCRPTPPPTPRRSPATSTS